MVHRLEIRLLGGFDVRNDSQRLTGFESQKVRALLAYLVCNRQRQLSRDILADLLWPDLDESAGRRNLRQALYNLRSALQMDAKEPSPVTATRNSIRLRSDLDVWCDVEAFQQVLAGSETSSSDTTPKELAGAVQLYRGDFLAGFYVKDSPAFDEWLTNEQERLRETVIEALKTLVEHYLESGSYSLGVQYAWRWVNLDPLSELAHRQLIRLYALTGRRERAVAQFEECRRILREELGIEPRQVTSNLYQWIQLQDRVESQPPPMAMASHYPQLSMVGRAQEMAQLLDWWQEGEGKDGLRICLIEGIGGVGKSHLVESVVESIRRRGRVNLLRARASNEAVSGSYQPVEEALRSAVMSQTGYIRRALAELSPIILAELTEMFPVLRSQRPDLPGRDPEAGTDALFEATGMLLEELCRPFEPKQPSVPLILFLDDLHLAGGDTFLLLERLASDDLAGPVRIFGCHLPEGQNIQSPIEELVERLSRHSPPVRRLRLGPLGEEALEQVSEQLLAAPEDHPLPRYLERQTGGLPVALLEVIYDRYESGHLRPGPDQRWHWQGELDIREDQLPTPLDELIWERARRLPRSARRLLTLAAVVGQRFDADLLARVEKEDLSVVWANLKIWIDRQMVRPMDEPWAEVERYPSPAPTDSTDLRVPIEFSHRRLRTVIYRHLPPSRRAAIHGQVAKVLEERAARGWVAWSETLAHHFAAAGDWRQAVRYHHRAADLARRHPSPVRTLLHCERALQLLPKTDMEEAEAQDLSRQLMRLRGEAREMLENEDAAPFLPDTESVAAEPFTD
ncbi:MAG: BTAD domain-containing putative transcriptional regulator [Acidobacteriota bacterium]|nr:BTAD domain-containing putative transcriptional regulator [Acidobacteriota bacterium]